MPLILQPGTTLVAATHNPGKAKELVALLDGRFTILSAGELGCPSRTRPNPPSSATPCSRPATRPI